MSVSSPFFTPSVQVASVHVPVVLSQTPLLQSAALAQFLVLGHPGQVPPPQSMSVSSPFFTPSVQAGAAQIPLWQTPLSQSPALAQLLPFAHTGQVPPPQSTSVSAPFFFLSVQVGRGASGGVVSGEEVSIEMVSADASTDTGGRSSSSQPTSSRGDSRASRPNTTRTRALTDPRTGLFVFLFGAPAAFMVRSSWCRGDQGSPKTVSPQGPPRDNPMGDRYKTGDASVLEVG